MNPDAPQPSFELPTPLPSHDQENKSGLGERVPAPGDGMAAPLVSMPSPATPPLPVSMHSATPAQIQSQPPTPLVAEDNDLIEKEWVEKAKRIVAETRQDPHAQNNAMSKFKADYMKKRYNKDIKVED